MFPFSYSDWLDDWTIKWFLRRKGVGGLGSTLGATDPAAPPILGYISGAPRCDVCQECISDLSGILPGPVCWSPALAFPGLARLTGAQSQVPEPSKVLACLLSRGPEGPRRQAACRRFWGDPESLASLFLPLLLPPTHTFVPPPSLVTHSSQCWNTGQGVAGVRDAPTPLLLCPTLPHSVTERLESGWLRGSCSSPSGQQAQRGRGSPQHDSGMWMPDVLLSMRKHECHLNKLLFLWLISQESKDLGMCVRDRGETDRDREKEREKESQRGHRSVWWRGWRLLQGGLETDCLDFHC
ncbi:hypothetical protein GH733_018693 [Mirounga leonina]|nr:hypothetical protein GH733_018693 [Mirounga leonina]